MVFDPLLLLQLSSQPKPVLAEPRYLSCYLYSSDDDAPPPPKAAAVDWVEAAKQKEQAEKEAAELAAQESRLAEAAIKQEELDEQSAVEAEAEAAERDKKRDERAAKRELDQSDRVGTPNPDPNFNVQLHVNWINPIG
jgi:hypothetical protein